jgi:hypothetical protein
MVLAGEEDILIPVVLSRELGEAVVGSVWMMTKGGHGCLVCFLLARCESKVFCDTDQFTVGVPKRLQSNSVGLSGHDRSHLKTCEYTVSVLYIPKLYITLC